MAGSLIGFFIGGKAVGRWGTKPIFLSCHFGFGLVMLLFLFRVTDPAPLAIVMLAVVHFLYGIVWAASSIAISTEMLALIPPDNKSISTSICTVLMRMGGALSGALSAWALNAGFLNERWTLLGRELSQYDTILLGFAIMVIMLVVTLGLVPSVLRKAEWVPRLRQL
jgi:MFS family permease